MQISERVSFCLKHTINRSPGLAHLQGSADLSLCVLGHMVHSYQVAQAQQAESLRVYHQVLRPIRWENSATASYRPLEASASPLWLSHKVAKPAGCRRTTTRVPFPETNKSCRFLKCDSESFGSDLCSISISGIWSAWLSETVKI